MYDLDNNNVGAQPTFTQAAPEPLGQFGGGVSAFAKLVAQTAGIGGTQERRARSGSDDQVQRNSASKMEMIY